LDKSASIFFPSFRFSTREFQNQVFILVFEVHYIFSVQFKQRRAEYLAAFPLSLLR